jgi:hypothetical protein
MDVCAFRLLPNNTFVESDFPGNRPSEPLRSSPSFTASGPAAEAHLWHNSEPPQLSQFENFQAADVRRKIQNSGS